MSKANKQLSLEFLHALCAGDVAKLKTLVTDDFMVIQPGQSLTAGTRSYADVMASCELAPQVFPGGVRAKVLHVTAEDDRVAIEWEGESTLANGQPYNNCYHFLVFVRGGKVALMKEYLDSKLVDEVLLPVVASLNA